MDLSIFLSKTKTPDNMDFSEFPFKQNLDNMDLASGKSVVRSLSSGPVVRRAKSVVRSCRPPR